MVFILHSVKIFIKNLTFGSFKIVDACLLTFLDFKCISSNLAFFQALMSNLYKSLMQWWTWCFNWIKFSFILDCANVTASFLQNSKLHQIWHKTLLDLFTVFLLRSPIFFYHLRNLDKHADLNFLWNNWSRLKKFTFPERSQTLYLAQVHEITDPHNFRFIDKSSSGCLLE